MTRVLAITNLTAIAWHLEQGEDNGALTHDALALFLRHAAEHLKGTAANARLVAAPPTPSASAPVPDYPHFPPCNCPGCKKVRAASAPNHITPTIIAPASTCSSA